MNRAQRRAQARHRCQDNTEDEWEVDVIGGIWALANQDMPDEARRLLAVMVMKALGIKVTPESRGEFISIIREGWAGMTLEEARAEKGTFVDGFLAGRASRQ